MLDTASSTALHALQNLALIVLSLTLLPLDTIVLILAKVVARNSVIPRHGKPPGRTRTILVTGVGMTKGLVLARLFAAAGNQVVGADFSRAACGRFSNSLRSFHVLESPNQGGRTSDYVQSVLSIVREEAVDLWVSCSGVASAIEDGLAKEAVEKHTNCKAVQYDAETTRILHEKSSFIKLAELIGLTVPETRTVTERGEMEKVLLHVDQSERKYICKSIGMDDAFRGDMTLLPLPSPEQTSLHLSRLNVSKENPWIVQQFINGREYCTHALVIKGHVKIFVACPSSELLMHYVALPAQSALSQAMLHFTREIAARGGENFTGHLSFDFLVENHKKLEPDEVIIYPIECNPRAHTAVALFSRTPELVDAYLTLLDETGPEMDSSSDPILPALAQKYYWVGHDLIQYILLPVMTVLIRQKNPTCLLNGITTFLDHLTFWKDGTFEWDDPLPWWCLYHVYWPSQFLSCLIHGQKWSRINVSTTKMFMC